MAKRIALFTISTIASKYKRVIKPVLSINADFYIRLFLIVVDSAEDSKHNCLKHGYVTIIKISFFTVELVKTKQFPLSHF
jgi:tRNA G26 N,N-dimethylase Trm1